jgi:hypothetical protein
MGRNDQDSQDRKKKEKTHHVFWRRRRLWHRPGSKACPRPPTAWWLHDVFRGRLTKAQQGGEGHRTSAGLRRVTERGETGGGSTGAGDGREQEQEQAAEEQKRKGGGRVAGGTGTRGEGARAGRTQWYSRQGSHWGRGRARRGWAGRVAAGVGAAEAEGQRRRAGLGRCACPSAARRRAPSPGRTSQTQPAERTS